MIEHDWAFIQVPSLRDPGETWQWCHLCGCLKVISYSMPVYFQARDATIFNGMVAGGTKDEPTCSPIPLKRCFLHITEWKVNRK